jgi:hypothetical protein
MSQPTKKCSFLLCCTFWREEEKKIGLVTERTSSFDASAQPTEELEEAKKIMLPSDQPAEKTNQLRSDRQIFVEPKYLSTRSCAKIFVDICRSEFVDMCRLVFVDICHLVFVDQY